MKGLEALAMVFRLHPVSSDVPATYLVSNQGRYHVQNGILRLM